MCVLDAPNKTFRLVVQLDDCEIVRDSLRFSQYKRALSHVATAIRDHAYDGALNEVILQQAKPADRPAMTAPADPAVDESWEDVERWGPDVVRRILAQDLLQRGKRLPPLGRTTPTHTPRPLKPAARRARTIVPPTPAPPIVAPPVNAPPIDAPPAVVPEPVRPSIPEPAPSPTPTPAPVVAPAPVVTPPAKPQTAARPAERKIHRSRAWYIVVGLAIVAGTWVSVLACMCGGQPSNVLRALEMREQPADAEAISFDGPVILPEPNTDER